MTWILPTARAATTAFAMGTSTIPVFESRTDTTTVVSVGYHEQQGSFRSGPAIGATELRAISITSGQELFAREGLAWVRLGPGSEAAREFPTDDVRAVFAELTRTWKKETSHSSFIRDMVVHPSYLRIVGMSWRAVPLILEELQRAPHHWAPALAAITGQDVVPASARGNLKKTTQAWLDWGRDHGFIA